ncbi:hypothetical protein O9K51_10192 [Purpureocillium lavendulum]|uniref:Uncharacterized protein n=1 Tax=Purpureocillium lavendulum TaxID=1247861 RepID=A0AB34FEI0_9HYPO|nr:hypothetical protein O9K51_10192 [Purpureocillium lavendulum]
MDAGSLAQMSANNFASHNGLPMPSGGLASRRGSQNIKPLSFDAIRQGNANVKDGGVPTPRTSRSHLLAGLRTAPKSATAASFGSGAPHSAVSAQQHARNSMAANLSGYTNGQDAVYNAPKTAFPQYGVQQNAAQGMMSHHQPQHQQLHQLQQQYTVEQVLTPPSVNIDEEDPTLYAQLVATNYYLAQQQRQLQAQLRSVQAAAQQFQQLNLSNPQLTQQQMAIYEQQQQLRNMQQQLSVQAAMSQGQQVYYNAATGQYFIDTSSASQVGSPYAEQPMSPAFNTFQQQQQQQQQLYHQQQSTPRVQVSPPPENQQSFRTTSPPKRYDSPSDVAPLPPPSANAFRRGHKKASSLAPVNSALAAAGGVADAPKSAGPKAASFPLTPMTGGYGPGQGRAGEHPIRQPRGPPSLDELKAKPTAKHEGSKNFATRTRRSAVHNLVRAGLERRKGTGSSVGSMSPVSETAEESITPITDNDSDSGRSGSGSLAGELECASSRTSASGSWGAIGSDRPISRQKTRGSVDSITSNGGVPTAEADNGSFADVFKNGALRATKAQDAADGQRKPSRLVLTSVERRKAGPLA